MFRQAVSLADSLQAKAVGSVRRGGQCGASDEAGALAILSDASKRMGVVRQRAEEHGIGDLFKTDVRLHSLLDLYSVAGDDASAADKIGECNLQGYGMLALAAAGIRGDAGITLATELGSVRELERKAAKVAPETK